LLELKLALFAHGDYNELWRMFGEGVRPRVVDLLDKLKPWLGAETYELWKRKHQYFEGGAKRSTFFYRGAAGSAAWLGVKVFEGSCPGGRKMLEELMNAGSIAEQKKIYKDLEGKFWNAFNRWLLQQSFIMALLGVPRPQIDLMQNQYPGGLERFVRDKLDHTLTELPISENYFWRAYSLGSYSTSCCPNYVKREHFETLRERRDRIHLHTMTMAEFLERNPGKYTHFVLLDHQDWLASHDTVALEQEWELILANSAPGAKVLMRSASPRIDFIPAKILKRLKIADGTAELHELDRVGTYGCTLLAEVA
jgi:S-adenosylmethionine-diacylglycerol 3-amino-3-carboxypropyl transferase